MTRCLDRVTLPSSLRLKEMTGEPTITSEPRVVQDTTGVGVTTLTAHSDIVLELKQITSQNTSINDLTNQEDAATPQNDVKEPQVCEFIPFHIGGSTIAFES